MPDLIIPPPTPPPKQTHYVTTRKGLKTLDVFQIAIGSYGFLEAIKLTTTYLREPLLTPHFALSVTSLAANLFTVAGVLDTIGMLEGYKIDRMLENNSVNNNTANNVNNALKASGIRAACVAGAIAATIPVNILIYGIVPRVTSYPADFAYIEAKENIINSLSEIVIVGGLVFMGSVFTDPGTTFTKEE